jgi:threonine synthase
VNADASIEQPLAGCEDCFAPLDVNYNYEGISRVLSRKTIASRPWNLWRYRELLPIDGDPVVGLASGGTPLVRASRLGRVLGIDDLYIKNDSVNSPTLSLRDRVTAVAINKALEFKLEAVGCASTGNLANSVAANSASATAGVHFDPRKSRTQQDRGHLHIRREGDRGAWKLR